MDYNSLNAKISAMRGRLFKPDDYEGLCSLRTVREFADRLRLYPGYRTVMKMHENVEPHRGVIEQSIIMALSEDYSRIYSFVRERGLKKYLDGYFLKLETGVIKLLLCMAYDEREIVYSLPELNKLVGRKFKIDMEKLKTAATVRELVDQLKGTPFHNLLYGRNEWSLFDMEMQLDLHYYMHLWGLTKKYLYGADKKIMRDVTGTEIDLRNIMWIHRLKKSYRMENTKIYSYLIPIRYKLTAGKITRMADAGDVSALEREIADSPYGGVFEGRGSVEDAFYNRMAGAYSAARHMNPLTVAETADYVFRKESEINNLTSIMEGVRYGLGPAEIMKYVRYHNQSDVAGAVG